MNDQINPPHPSASVVIIGGGPAGLMAADVVADAGFSVAVYDAMPSLGRKFLLAGVGGMNITHAEDPALFLSRYGAAAGQLAPFIRDFDAQALREWVHGLGIETFVGTSGRVFPTAMKAAPLLRAWLHRLREKGVRFFPRHHWLGWTEDGALRFQTTTTTGDTTLELKPDACVLALGGASWPRLGSDGAWVPWLRQKAVSVTDLQPSNCGFETQWSDIFRDRCAGEPLNTISVTVTDRAGNLCQQRGEATLTAHGIEGNVIYAMSALLREKIQQEGAATLLIDLLPDQSETKIFHLLQKPRGKESFSNFLRKQLKLPPVKIQLLRERVPSEVWQDNALLAKAIKALPIPLLRARPLSEAISSAGGISFSAVDDNLMLKDLPGVFCAGEMLDWEAPTGGYLLTACFALGRAAGYGAVNCLKKST